jgi:tetratricopeptide (TPR) repeat protein
MLRSSMRATHPKRRPDPRAERATPHAGTRRADPAEAAPATTATRAALVLWIGLATLAVARIVLGFVPGMWAWGLNLHRFLTPALLWLPWIAAAAVLAPPVARRLEPACARLGGAIAGGSALALLAFAAAAALIVWLMPDRVRFVGDFLIRQGTVEEAIRPSQVWPQALPLDVFLHYTLPLAISDAGLTDANGAARVLGALEAVLLALAACAFARALALKGAEALAVAAVAFFGGGLGLFTGYSKAFAEMVVLTAAAAAFGVAAIRQGRGLLPLGIVVAIGLVLHRSALGLVPAAILAWAMWLRAHGGGGRWRERGVLIALAVPVATLAVMAPRIVRIALRWDPTHFASAEVMAQGGIWNAAFAGSRPWDLLSLVLLLSPLAVLAPALAVSGAAPGRREALYLSLLALPFVAVAPFLHPVGGLLRDWDDFAAMGAALSMLTALLVAATLRRAAQPWLAVAVTLAVALPACQWLAFHTVVDRGIARAFAAVSEPPGRIGSERASIWDWVGMRNYQIERWRASADAFKHAVETAPSSRMLQQWAMAETMAGDLEAARAAYHLQLEKDPESYAGWMGLAAVTSRIPDFAECRRALGRLLEIRPGDPDATRLLRILDEEEARRAGTSH